MYDVLLHRETAEELGKCHDPGQADAYWGGWNAKMGAVVARAVAYTQAVQGGVALAQLDAIQGCAAYQPWWAARARVM